jgi:FMN phosphatase YigB (HAD superfamily)
MTVHTKPVIGLDVDGVIFDYVAGLMEYANSRGIRVGCASDKVDTWSMSAAFPDLDDDAIWNLIETFSESEGFGRLQPFPGALEAIAQLVAEYPDYPLVAITSAGKSEVTKNLRVQNLQGIPFSEIHVLPLGESKEDYLAKFPANSLYVDDLKKNVNVAEKVGVAGVFVRRSYNTADTHTRIAHDWDEIVAHVRDILPPTLKADPEMAAAQKLADVLTANL